MACLGGITEARVKKKKKKSNYSNLVGNRAIERRLPRAKETELEKPFAPSEPLSVDLPSGVSIKKRKGKRRFERAERIGNC